MPTYDYECTNCKHTFQELHDMATRLQKCPKCAQLTLVRLIGSGSGFIFKGDGFYATRKETNEQVGESLSE